MKISTLENKITIGGSLRGKTDLIIGVIMSFFSLFCIFWLIPSNTISAEHELDLNPGFMPLVAMWTCFILSIMLIVKRLKYDRTAEEDEEFGDEATGLGLNEISNFGQWCLFSFVAMVLLTYVGFEVSGFFIISGLMYYACLRNYYILGGVSIFLPIFLYQFVWFIFEIELP